MSQPDEPSDQEKAINQWLKENNQHMELVQLQLAAIALTLRPIPGPVKANLLGDLIGVVLLDSHCLGCAWRFLDDVRDSALTSLHAKEQEPGVDELEIPGEKPPACRH